MQKIKMPTVYQVTFFKDANPIVRLLSAYSFNHAERIAKREIPDNFYQKSFIVQKYLFQQKNMIFVMFFTSLFLHF